MSYGITPEDRKKMRELSKRFNKSSSEPEYERVEGYHQIDVFRDGKQFKVVHENDSIRLPRPRPHRTTVSNFLTDYLEFNNFDRAYRENYTVENSVAKEFETVLDELDEELEQDIEKLARDLSP